MADNIKVGLLTHAGAHITAYVSTMKDSPLTGYTMKGERTGKLQTDDGVREPRGYTPFTGQSLMSKTLRSQTSAFSLPARPTAES